MRRLVPIVLLAALVALAAPSTASAWKYVFQDWLEINQGAIAGSHIAAKKCQGGMLGTYDFRSFVGSESSDGSTLLEVEVEARMPVTTQFKPFKNITVTVVGSVEPSIIEATRDALADFYATVEVKYKKDKLLVEHGPFVIYGTEVLAAGPFKTKFKPKPGC